MIGQLFKWTIFFVLTLGVFSCKGQVKKDLVNTKSSEPKMPFVGQPNLVKTQGANEGDNVHCSLEDKAGNLWFGTTSEGIYKYDGNSFRQFTVSDGLCSNVIWHLFEDKDGKIWIATDDGLNCYDGKTFSKIRITLPIENNLITTTFKNNTPSNDIEVFSIMQDRNGQLWFATVDGVYCYDGKTFSSFIVDKGGGGFKSKKNNVEYMLEDKTGNIWFGGRNNVGVFCYDGKSVTNIKLKELKGNDWAWPVLQDRSGNIWFSNWGGAYRYDGKSFTTFTKDDGLCSDIINRILEDKNGNLWFGCGSKDGGLSRYDGKSFTCFTKEDGLINNDIWTILEDKTGNFWLGSRETALCRYNGKTFTSFSENKLLFPLGN